MVEAAVTAGIGRLVYRSARSRHTTTLTMPNSYVWENFQVAANGNGGYPAARRCPLFGVDSTYH